jgi:glycosyltransferase involved in cell wall biosynthesis
MRVVWAGTFDPEFSRNKKLTKLLGLAQIDVETVREDLWSGDRVTLAGKPTPQILLRAVVRYPRLLFRLLRAGRPDVYLVSYPGWFDMPLLRIVASLKRRPIVFDPFLSLHDTMIADRGLHTRGSLMARAASLFDRWSLRMADTVIADTAPQLDFYRRVAGKALSDGSVLPVGADDDLFAARPEIAAEPRRVLYYGNYIPLHGVATIVEAATLLQPDEIELTMIGDGPDQHLVAETVRTACLRVDRHGTVPLDELPAHVARASICLGVFGASDKAGRVIPHKVYEAIAMRKPVVTREGPAVAATFREGDVVTVPPQDPGALADAIRGLLADPMRRDSVADAGYETYQLKFAEPRLSADLLEILQAAVLGRH